MRVVWIAVGALMMWHNALTAHVQAQMPARQLVREVVYNELNDHARHGHWRYWVERRSSNGTLREEQVETVEGPVKRLILRDGRPLSPEDEQQEQDRLQKLLVSPGEQARHLKQYDEDEERIGRILALLPDAFVYEYDGEEMGCYRLRFHSNPNYPPRTIEARIFHAMSGRLWVDAGWKRLVRLEGRVDENVDFGYGILGRLYQGGWFRLERVQVSASDWKTESLEIHMNIRALLVKTFARDTSEERGGFVAVPAELSLAEGMALLNKSPGPVQAEGQDAASPPSGNGLGGQTALAMRP